MKKRKVFLSGNKVEKDDLRNKLPPLSRPSLTRKVQVLPSTDRLDSCQISSKGPRSISPILWNNDSPRGFRHEGYESCKIADRSISAYGHQSRPSGECGLTVSLSLNSATSSNTGFHDSLPNHNTDKSRDHEDRSACSSSDFFRNVTTPNYDKKSSEYENKLPASSGSKSFQKSLVKRERSSECENKSAASSGKKSYQESLPKRERPSEYGNKLADSFRKDFRATLPNRRPKRPYKWENELMQSSTHKRFKCSTSATYSSSTMQSFNSSTAFPEENHLEKPKQSQQTNDMNIPQTSAQKTQSEKEKVLPIGYKYVEKLCNEDDPEETAASLIKDSTFRRFEALLDEKDIRYDLMKVIVSLIENACRSRVESHSNKVLGIIQKTNFWDTLSAFVADLYSNNEAINDPCLPTLITNLCKIFNLCIERLPNLHSSIPIPQLKDTIEFFKAEGKLDDSKIEHLLEDMNTKRQQIMKEKRVNVSSQLQPPDDFRKLSVFPSMHDIFGTNKTFLRENLVDTPYPNVDHYLDVQFRLLKEDSLAGLRKGIRDLRGQDKMRKHEAGNFSSKPNRDRHKADVMVYHNVKINAIATDKNNTSGCVYNVSFNHRHPSIKRVNWVRSKKLMHGSLVCLVSDDFETLYFATVQNRDPKALQAGYIQLCFEGLEVPRPRQDGEESYRMVESSSAYFVAYRHILKRLQEITVETMPFKDYIISCNREIKQPAYLLKKDVDGNKKMIDFTSIVEKSKLKNEDGENNFEALQAVDPDDLSTWPDSNVLGLNESQYGAFQSALRKEFAIIQGPPGTGKTYVGLKIAHVLLANCTLWKDFEGESCPILMLSFTNHALDQFLEGLAVDKRDIIRAGGRSSSHSIRNCNLSVVRRERRHETPIYGFTQSEKRRLGEVNQHLRELEYDLHRYTNTYRQSFEGILPLRELKAFMKHDHVDALSIDDYGLLDFLCITPKPASEKERTSSVEQEDDYFGLEPEDNAGNFSAGRFKDFEEEKGDRQLEYDKVVICFADETRNAKKIQDNLKEMKDCKITRVNHIEETYPHDLLWELNDDERWLLYRSWLVRLREQFNKNILSLQEQHLKLSIEREELRNIEDLSILRGARVIGMTTTWASKNHRLLHQLRPRVMIIEEAAEVFEGHVVSSLTQYCQHLILIGDHQQLRPNPSVHYLVKYHLDVSLFERMIRTNVSYNRLSVQHRMRPEISQIVRHIYNDLEDHVSVTEYDDVKGISKNLFFVDHSFQEETSSNTHSKTNLHEASFLIALCHYLLRQGYDSSQITILTTYTGQMFTIRDQAKEWFSLETQPPRVASVDNFQGEENDIILLSLVRSNDEENIGFLKTSNRVCVALSRAKKGLYIVGNRAILAKKSPLWKAILDGLHKNDCVGNSLTLVCKKHGNENHVSSDKEFKEKVPNGGCLQPCQHRLECGHACPEICHPDDHESYQCKKLCERNVAGCQLEGHKCTKKCYEPCDTNCKYPLEKKLSCGHTMELSCSANVNLAKCKEQCEKTLCCGHRCQDSCSVACTKKCLELVTKTGWSCGHENTIACSATQKDCQVPCNAILDCGHCCPGKCGQCIQGRVHVLCKAKCERNLVCSHSCKAYCTKNCPPCKQPCLRKCDHSQCGHFCGEICILCKEPCKWECQHFKCTKLCSEMCDRPRCDQPCNRKLECGNKNEPPHFCRGLCGERCICVLCHKNNKDEPITNIIFGTEDEEGARFIRLKDCEHIFEVTALDKLLDGNDDSNEIKMKLCPLCKRPIEKTWRYANVVKKLHQDIDNVKRKILADAVDLDDRKKLVKHLVSEVADAVTLTIASNTLSKSQPLKKIMKFIEKSSEVNYHEVLLMESQVRLVRNWLLVKKDYKDAMTNADQRCKSVEHIEFIDEMQNIWDRIMFQPSWCVNARILSDLRLELERMSLKKNVLGLQAKLDKIELSLKKADEESIINLTKTLKDKARIEEDVIEQLAQQIAGIYSKHPQLTPITQQEKVQIVKAIGLKQGHWFKCPQGHVYAIGECGGAMEKSQCPECGAVIGGQLHLLEDGNELAPEMDGAQHAAWSEQANIQNYEMGV